jgi:hypothetical protein
MVKKTIKNASKKNALKRLVSLSVDDEGASGGVAYLA